MLQRGRKKPGPPTKPKPKLGDIKKEPVGVYCRFRPLKNPQDRAVVRKKSDEIVEIVDPAPYTACNKYRFKHVFSANASQKQIFENTTLPMVKDLLDGQNG